MRPRVKNNVFYTLSAIIVAMALSGERVMAQQPVQIISQADLVGTKWVKARKNQRFQPYEWTLVFSYSGDQSNRISSGSLATFGVFDSGEIVLINRTDHTPNLTSVSVHRTLYPEDQFLEKSELPKYLMTCAWPQTDDEVPKAMFVSFVERDDNNYVVRDNDAYLSVSARWTQVPEKQAKQKFGGFWYCDELATTKKSSAPLWLPATTY